MIVKLCSNGMSLFAWPAEANSLRTDKDEQVADWIREYTSQLHSVTGKAVQDHGARQVIRPLNRLTLSRKKALLSMPTQADYALVIMAFSV